MNLKAALFFTLCCFATITFAQPSNDDPCNAISLSLSTSCVPQTYTNDLATATAGVTVPGCGGYTGGDVWFTFTMPSYGYHTQLELSAIDFTSGGMAVYSGTDCSTLTLVACDENSGTSGMPALTVEDGCGFADAGATFWVRVWENGNDNNGDFDICAYATPPNVPSGVVSCGGNLLAGDACCDAVLLGDELNGYCGNTGNYNDLPDEFSDNNDFCANVDNNTWLAFVAGDTTSVLEITSYNCLFGNGIQVVILETTNCTDFELVSNCWNPGSEDTGLLTANNLTIGQTYYIMVDGWGGDVCDYSLSIVSGVETVTVSASDEEICQGQSTQLQVDVAGAGTYTYNWAPATSLDDPSSPMPVATPTSTTNYSVTISGIVDSVQNINITVFPAAPAQPSITGATSVCQNTSTSYTAVATNATSYSWSVTGGATISGSSTDATVQVDWGSSGGTVCLVASNDCGSSPSGCITVTTAPEPDISATPPGTACMPEGLDLTSVVVTNSAGGSGPISYHYTLLEADAGTNAIFPPVVYSSGTYFIRMETSGSCYDVTSVDITVEDPALVVVDPAAVCSPNEIELTSVVVNEINGYPGGTTSFYTDSLEAVATTNALTNTSVGTGGTYWVRYETPGGCGAVASIEVAIDESPDITVVQPAPLCPGGSLDLATVGLIDNGGTVYTTYYYNSLALAMIGLPALAMSNTVVSTSQSYYLRAVTPNNCAQVVEIIVTTGAAPAAAISGGGTFCAGETANLTFVLSGSGPFDVTYSDGTNTFNLTDINDGHVESFVISSATTFSLVSINDANGCNGSINSGPVTYSVNSAPTASISGDAAICGTSNVDLSFSFTGTGPFDVVFTDDLNNQTSLNNISNGHTETVSVSTNTVFTLVSVSDAQGCNGTISGSATITQYSPLTISGLSESCDASYTSYTVSFSVSGGDPSSYDVTGATGSWSGNTWTSDPLPSGSTYNLIVSDASPCGDESISGTVNCQCATDAGIMDASMVEVCENETATAVLQAGSETLNAGDLLQYVLHDNAGNTLGNIFDTSNSPTFGLQAGMLYGQTYYISSIAGPDNGSGNVDQSHTCFSVAPGTPVVFYALPTAAMSGTTTICAGGDALLTFNITTGTGPFDLTYSDGTNSYAIDDVNDGHQLTVSPANTTTYTLTSIVDNTGASCSGSVNGTATITVVSAPQITNVDLNCNATNTAYQVTFTVTGGDPSTYNIGGDAGTFDATTGVFTSDFINSGTAYNFSVDDVNGCGPNTLAGNFVCDCTTQAGAMGTNTLSLCEDDVAMANHLTASMVLDGDDVLGFVLHDAPGNVLGSVTLTNTTPEFAYDPNMVFGQTYYISAIVANDDGSGFPVLDSGLDPCQSVTPGQPVVFTQNPTAAITGDETICAGDSATLTFHLQGGGPFNVSYTDGASNFQLNAIQDGHQLKVAPMTPTNYTVTSVNLGSTPSCDGTVDPVDNTATVDVIAVPSVLNYSVDCNPEGTAFQVTFDITGGDPANYAVAGDMGTLAGNSFTSEWLTSGNSFSFSVNDGTACPPIEVTGTEYCNCTPDIRPAISMVGPISCYGESDGSLQVTNENGVPPFNFNWSNEVVGEFNDQLQSGWYTVSMTDGNNCLSVDSIYLDEPTAITADVEIEDPSCFGDGDSDGTINFVDVNGGAGGYTYYLDYFNYPIDPGINNLSAGIYQGTIVDAAGCEWQQEILLNEPDEFILDLGPDLEIALGDSVVLLPQVNHPVTDFRWSGWQVPCDSCWEQTLHPLRSYNYVLQVTNDEGCTTSDEIIIKVTKEKPIYIPTAFSPNGDGYNDIFTVYSGPGVVEIRKFRVFNRWGEELYNVSGIAPGNADFGWDGSLAGQELSHGVYVYFVEVLFSDGSVELFQGDVTLMR